MSGAIVNRDRSGSPALIKRAKPYEIHRLGVFRDSYLPYVSLVRPMFRRHLKIPMAPTEMLCSFRAL